MEQAKCKWHILPSSVYYICQAIIVLLLNIIIYRGNLHELLIVIACVICIFAIVITREVRCYRFISEHMNDVSDLSNEQEDIIYYVLQYCHAHCDSFVNFCPRKFKCIRTLSTSGFEVELMRDDNKSELYQFYKDRESNDRFKIIEPER